MKPRIFIVSATKRADVAAALQLALEQREDYLVTIWDQGVFGLSQYPLPALLDRAKVSDYAVIVVGQDEIKVRPDGSIAFVPNPNVILEYGLFLGILGIGRVFVLVPAPAHALVDLPSDLIGLTVARYDPSRADGNLDAAMGSAVRQITREIASSWSSVRVDRSRSGRVQFFEAFNADFERLSQSCTTLELGFIHSRRWRETHGDTVKRRLHNGQIRSMNLYLPDAKNAGFLGQLATRFSDGPVIPSMIYDAYRWALEAADKAANVRIWLFGRMPSFTFYKFDTEAVIALYPLSRVKKPVPSLAVLRDSETWAFLERDIADFEAECRRVEIDDLRAVCERFERSGRF